MGFRDEFILARVKQLKLLAIFLAHSTLKYALGVAAFFVSMPFGPKKSAIPLIDDQNLVMPAIILSKQIKDGHVISEEVVESYIKRIKKINPMINALVDERFEHALKEARGIDRRLAEARNNQGDTSILGLQLVGVPVSVKETIGIAGHTFTGGLMSRKFVKAPENAAAVDRLLLSGLIPIGLTNTPELAMWWDASNPVHGQTKNPYDLSCITGGSTGGEAALLAAAGSVVGLGSDVGGSIRIPANFCGVFGHKPTPFIVPTEGIFPDLKGEREKMLSLGPMTRYACDLTPMLKVLAGPKASQLILDEPVDLTKMRLFYIEDIGDPLAVKCNPDIIDALRVAVEYFANKFKIETEKVTFDEFQHGILVYGDQ